LNSSVTPANLHAAVAAINTDPASANNLALYTVGASSFNGSMSVRTTIASTSGGYSVNSSDYFVILASGYSGTLTLPTPATAGNGRVLIIKNNSVAPVTSSTYIDNTGSPSTTINPGTVQLINDGTNWQRVN
jgi:hypothetical protein